MVVLLDGVAKRNEQKKKQIRLYMREGQQYVFCFPKREVAQDSTNCVLPDWSSPSLGDVNSAVVSDECAIQHAAHVANQAKLAIRLSDVREEYASANSAVGTISTNHQFRQGCRWRSRQGHTAFTS